MTKVYKIDGKDYIPESYTAEEVVPAVQSVLAALVSAQNPGIESDRMFDTGFSIEALCVLIASMLEVLPSLKTNRDMRVMAESIGDRVAEILKYQRSVSERTGEHVIEMLGASKRMPEGVTRQ